MSPTKRCEQCGRVFTIEFFRLSGDASMHASRRHMSVCMGCEQTARDKTKREMKRFPAKVDATTRRHSQKLGIPVIDLVLRYGWDAKRMAHEAEYAYGNGCSYCGEPYGSIGHGLSDLTLDIVDPTKEPYYVVNTRWCCKTCNTSKARSDPATWAAKLAAWNEWRKTPMLKPMQVAFEW